MKEGRIKIKKKKIQQQTIYSWKGEGRVRKGDERREEGSEIVRGEERNTSTPRMQERKEAHTERKTQCAKCKQGTEGKEEEV